MQGSNSQSNKSGVLLYGIEAYQLTAGEAYMNKNQLNHFESLLNNLMKSLIEEADVTVHHMKDEPAGNLPDQSDRASQEEGLALELRNCDRRRKLLEKVKEALQRIKNNEFGFCDECGEEIGLRRLEVRPTATLCIDCKTLAEIKEKQIGGN